MDLTGIKLSFEGKSFIVALFVLIQKFFFLFP